MSISREHDPLNAAIGIKNSVPLGIILWLILAGIAYAVYAR